MSSVSTLQNRVQSSLAKRPALVNLRNPTKTKADLFSNDFLSLSSDTRLRATVLDRLTNERGSFLGATGSRMLDGNTAIHVSFEAKLRDYYGAEAALLFNSGYDANVGLFGTLPVKGDVIVYDELIHASVLDGIRFSQAARSSYSFHHNSVLSLKSVLQKLLTSNPRVRSGSCTVFVALETVYSMDGDVAPLQELLEVVENTLPKGCSQIFIDESHSAGVYGPEGRGLISHLGLEKRVHIRLYTFSKALAGSGGQHFILGFCVVYLTNFVPAVLLCTPLVRTYLINGCRPFIYSTALSRICIIAAEASLDIVRSPIGDQVRLSFSLCFLPEIEIIPTSFENVYLCSSNMLMRSSRKNSMPFQLFGS
jgi:8-amino-7-oxononanoate synthase